MSMKAIVWTDYGPPEVLQLRDVARPVPKDNELLIRTYAATVTAGDCEARRLDFPFYLGLPMRFYMGIRKPSRVTILGQELAGEVEEVGKYVTGFKPGDEIVAATLFRFGAYAEYTALPQTHPILLKPNNMSFEEAATIPTGGMNALHFVRKAAIQPGDTVLINGAGGSIGTYAIQIAKASGAVITAVDSASKLDLLRSLGADEVIDYTEHDFTQTGRKYDAIIDVIGKRSVTGMIDALNPGGRLVLGNPTLSGNISSRWATRAGNKTINSQPAGYPPEAMQFLKDLIEAGEVKAVIDRSYPLAETAEAHRYVETGAKAGNVVIALDHTGSAG